eukprot:NODE_627_length_5881_cov_0.181771.p3 type:complete len:390 gc:universal NODE_627_length_5881_cov_0.181771:2372-1203(-)
MLESYTDSYFSFLKQMLLVSSNPFFYPEQFKKWLTSDETSKLSSFEMEQYRLYNYMEPMLKNPSYFISTDLLNITPHAKIVIVQTYYQLNDTYVRELLGKKLSSRTKKEMEETLINEKQFNNIKFIIKRIEEMKPGEKGIQVLKSEFCFQNDLAVQYSLISFLCIHRFECLHKKLRFLSFSDILFCTASIMSAWQPSLLDPTDDLEVYFVKDLKSLRLVMMTKEGYESFKTTLNDKIDFSVSQPNNFRNLIRNLIYIGSMLDHSKYLRLFFHDLLNKVVDGLLTLRLDMSQLEQLFIGILKCFGIDDVLKIDEETMPIYQERMCGYLTKQDSLESVSRASSLSRFPEAIDSLPEIELEMMSNVQALAMVRYLKGVAPILLRMCKAAMSS